MAKAEAWRLEAGNYPISMIIPPRYADLDTLGHINNVALAAMFETARVHFHHLLGHHPADAGVRWLVAAVDLKYVAEAHFPYDVTICSGIGRIGIGDHAGDLFPAQDAVGRGRADLLQ